MAKTKNRKYEPDSVYFMKIVLYFILGGIWVYLDGFFVPGLPIGLLIGLLFARHDHFQIDRKIEYAVLLAAAILSYVAPIGLVLRFDVAALIM